MKEFHLYRFGMLFLFDYNCAGVSKMHYILSLFHYLQLGVHGKVGNRQLTFYEGIGVFPQIIITKYELGTGKTIHSYAKAFWYFGEPKTINN